MKIGQCFQKGLVELDEGVGSDDLYTAFEMPLRIWREEFVNRRGTVVVPDFVKPTNGYFFWG